MHLGNSLHTKELCKEVHKLRIRQDLHCPKKEFFMVFNKDQGIANFLHKGPESKYFGFVNHKVSISTNPAVVERVSM